MYNIYCYLCYIQQKNEKTKKALHKLGVHHKMEAPQSVPEDYRVTDSILMGGKWGRIMLTLHPIPALVAPKRRHFFTVAGKSRWQA